MEEALEYIVVVWALYLAECLVVLAPSEVIFTPGWGGGYRQRRLLFYPGNGAWGWRLLDPLLPFQPVFRARGSVAAGLNASAAATRLREFGRASRALRAMVGLNCVAALIAFPLAAVLWGVRPVIVPAVGVALAMSAITAALVLRLDGPGKRRWWTVAKLVVYPVSSLRALDRLALEAVEGLHPLAVAFALCDANTARKAAVEMVAELLHMASPVEAQQVDRFLSGHGIRLADLLAPPPRMTAMCRAYCPRCRVQYRDARLTCPDCQGIALKAFP